MIRTLGWVCWLFGYMLLRLPLFWRCRYLAKKGRMAQHDAIVEKQVVLWSGRLLRHIKMDVTVEGLENIPKNETVVYAANHQSYLDIPVVLGHILPPHPLMAKKGLGKIPLLSGWMRQLGCLFVDREDARAALTAMKQAEEMLKNGKSMYIFPEGTRAISDTIGEFKAGVVRIALKAGVRVVPVAIDGTWRGLEGNKYVVKPAQVRLKILPPVDTQGLDRAQQKQLAGRLEEMIRAAKDSAT